MDVTFHSKGCGFGSRILKSPLSMLLYVVYVEIGSLFSGRDTCNLMDTFLLISTCPPTGDLVKITGHSQKGFKHFSSRYTSTRAV